LTITNCPVCGGEHWGSYKCPYIEAPCVVCGTPTIVACADCAINSGGKESVHVCDKSECRHTHERLVHPPKPIAKPLDDKAEIARLAEALAAATTAREAAEARLSRCAEHHVDINELRQAEQRADEIARAHAASFGALDTISTKLLDGEVDDYQELARRIIEKTEAAEQRGAALAEVVTGLRLYIADWTGEPGLIAAMIRNELDRLAVAVPASPSYAAFRTWLEKVQQNGPRVAIKRVLAQLDRLASAKEKVGDNNANS
jgi:hypothetical protein